MHFDLNMDDALPLHPSLLPSNFITMLFQSMSLSDRLKCALVCKAWAQEATAATRSIILRDRIQDLSCLKTWLEKHGGQVEVLQLHECPYPAKLTALPCQQLQDLLLWGGLSLDGSVWRDIAAATKLTSVSLEVVQTASQQADVVSALTALLDLEQLTWCSVRCGPRPGSLSDSKLLQKLTKLTALALSHVNEAALEHLGLLTRLQDLSLVVTDDWAAAGCPGLQELKALTRLVLIDGSFDGVGSIPSSVSQLTALQQLKVPRATPTALNKLSALTLLTQLHVDSLVGLSSDSPPLQLPGLQHLEVVDGLAGTMPKAYLGSSTQMQVLKLRDINLSGPGSLVASTMLQHLELRFCGVSAADGAADPVSWQQVFPGPGRRPHLTSLKFASVEPDLQHADMECVVACCSNLQVLQVEDLPDSFAPALTRLSGLTSLMLGKSSDQQCSALAQLTGLRELRLMDASEVFAAGLRQLAALEQLTSLGLHSLGWSSDVLREHMSDRLPGPHTYEYGISNKVCGCGCMYVCVWVCVWGGVLSHSQWHPNHCFWGSRPRQIQIGWRDSLGGGRVLPHNSSWHAIHCCGEL